MITQETFQDDLSEIFEAARQRSVNRFYLSLSHVVDLAELQAFIQRNVDGPFLTVARVNIIPKSLHSVTNLSAYTNYLDARGDQHEFLTMYSKLYAYLQALETKYTYKVLGNLLHVLLDLDPNGELFDDLHSGHQCYDAIKRLNEQVLARGIEFSLFGHMDTIMNRRLRNAIAHNDIYLYSAARTMQIPSYTVLKLTHPNEADEIQDFYDFDDLHDRYESAMNFTEAFKAIVSQHIDLGSRY